MARLDTSAIPLSRTGRPHVLRLAAVAATGLVALMLAGLVTVMPYGRAMWDFVFVLDGAYRISLGQVPHIDFSSPVGSLTLYLAAAADHLNPSGNAFVGLHVLMWLLLLPPLAALAPRFGSGWAFGAAVGLTALIVLVPMTLEGTHLSEISYFATYNRFASGLLFLAGLWYVLPRRDGDWFVPAYLLFLLFFLKITAALLLAGLLVAAVVLRRCGVWNAILAMAAFVIPLAVVEVATGLASAYLRDVAQMGAINRGGLVYALFFAGFRNWLPLAVAGIMAIAALWAVVRQARHRPFAAFRIALTQEAFTLDVLLLVSVVLLAESQNTGGFGLISAAAVLFHPSAWDRRPALAGLLLAALVFPVLDIAVKRPLTALTRERPAAPVQVVDELIPGTRVPLSTYEGAKLFSRIATEWLPLAREVQEARFFLTPDPTTNAPAAQLAWFASVVEASKRFEELGYRDLADSYATLSFADPFTRHLKLRPATGINLVMHVGRTIPAFSTEQARAYLAGSDGIFVDRCDMAQDVFERTFAAALDSDFRKMPLTQCWDFHVREGNG